MGAVASITNGQAPEVQEVRTTAVNPNSVEIAYNAKREPSFVVKVYGESPDEVATKALEIASRVRESLTAVQP